MLSLNSATLLLCGPEQITQPLWASVLSSFLLWNIEAAPLGFTSFFPSVFYL